MDSFDPRELGLKIRRVREAAGDTQGVLSKVLGITLSGVSKVESGLQAITAEQLGKFIEQYKVSADELLGFSRNDREQTKIAGVKNPLRDLFLQVAERYLEEKQEGKFAGSKIGDVVRNQLPKLLIDKASIDDDKYLVVGSIGIGNFAEIPWVCVFNKKITSSATNGIYVVYLFSADMSQLFVTLNQGWTYFQESFGTKKGRENVKYVADQLRVMLSTSLKGFDSSISLRGQGTLGRGYESGCIASKRYDLNNLPSDKELINDVRELLGIYEQVDVLLEGRTVIQLIEELLKKKRDLFSETSVEEEIDYQKQAQKLALEESEEQQNDEVNEEGPKDKGKPYVAKGGKHYWPRNAKLAAKALKKANFCCEYDPAHQSFTARKTRRPYQEVHHLIPLEFQNEFECSLDCISNLTVLCSRDHDCLHFGVQEEREVILGKLFDERVESLAKSGIIITKAELFNMYRKEANQDDEE
ncbi:MrcB family domain-containing protein [Peribacillus frigoritolerans]|uniref:DUF3578 domain-containing protein n=1 Tax=Peribacillus frigoritolerans TaxID=450367 RepID=A0AAJ1QLL8_9BACI|nr:DUF3578 domain-containing protein [Peribacillus frigoritolerans]MDM5283801.1 DUF3578 domain-containing protein [Peribacillus frigoritolerans]